MLQSQSFYFSLCFAALSVFLFLFWTLTQKSKGTLFAGLSFLSIVVTLRGILSLILIEYGSYIPEQGIHGFHNGALLYFLLFSSITYLILFYCVKDTKTLSEEPEHGDFIDLIFFALFLFKILVSLSVAYNFPQLNKFNFYGSTFSPRIFLAVDLIFEALLWAQMVRRTSYFWLWAAFSFFIAFSKRAYFGAIISPIEMVIFALMIRGKITYRTILMVATPLVIIALLVKMKTLHGNPRFLFDRFVMDNHMFWGAINLSHNQQTVSGFSSFFNDFWNFGLYQANPKYGLGEFMAALNPPIAQELMKNNIRFTNGYPGILIFKTGLFMALLLHAVFTFVYFKIWKFFLRSITAFTIIELVVFYKVFSNYQDFMVMGEYGYFKAKFLIMLGAATVFILGMKYIRKHFSKNGQI